MLSDDLIERTARAIEDARCPHREGPYGGYDYGHRGDPVEGGRYIIRDFRDPCSDDWGRWVHQTDDQDLHDATLKRMTEHHIARAAIAIIAPAVLDMVARIPEKRAEERFDEHGVRDYDTNATYYSGRAAELFESLDEEDEAVREAILAIKAQFEGDKA